MSSHDLAHLQRLLLGARVVLVEDERVARVVGAHLAGLTGEDRSRRVPFRWIRRILDEAPLSSTRPDAAVGAARTWGHGSDSTAKHGLVAHAVLVVIELLHHGGSTDARTRSRPEEVACRWRDAKKSVSENNEGHASVVDSLHEATRVLVRHEAHHLAIELLLCVLACHVRCRLGFFLDSEWLCGRSSVKSFADIGEEKALKL